MEIAPHVFLLAVMAVGVVCLLVGVRLGLAAARPNPASDDEQLATALGVLRRHFERKALADMEASGVRLWTPDRERLAALSFGARRDASVATARNAKVGR